MDTFGPLPALYVRIKGENLTRCHGSMLSGSMHDVLSIEIKFEDVEALEQSPVVGIGWK